MQGGQALIGRDGTRISLRARAPGVRFVLVASLVIMVLPGAMAEVGPVSVDAPVRELTVRPQEIATFPLNVTNLGTSPVQLRFAVHGDTGGLTVPVPTPLTVEAGGAASLAITAVAPHRNGRVDQRDPFQVEVAPFDARSPGVRGEATFVAFEVHTRGLHVPGPHVWLLLSGVGAAVALRAHREDIS